MRARWNSPFRVLLAGLLALGLPALVRAQTEEAAEKPPSGVSGRAPAPVGLEDLLKLPDSIDYGVERRAGATRGEWRERFRTVRGELSEERESLQRSREELEKVAGSAESWTLAPPGGATSTDAPLDYRLRAEIRQHEAEVERLERRLRDLEVEANLAGVPEEWRN